MTTLSTAPASPPTTRLPALLVFGGGVSAALHIWKLPPALPALQISLGLSLTEAGWLIGVFQLAGMLLGLLFGLFVQRLGLKPSLLWGLLLLAVASFVGAFMDSLLGLLALRIIEGFALLLVTMAAPSLMRQLAPEGQQSFLMALWSSYIPLASMLALLGGSVLLQYLDWPSLWRLCGALSLLMALLLWRQLSPELLGAGLQPQPWSEARRAIKQTLSAKAPWLLSLTFTLYSSQWVAIISFLPLIYHEAGVSGGLMGVLTALTAGANLSGNLMAGRLLQRQVAPQRLFVVAFVTMLLMAFVGFGLNLGPWVQFVAICVFSAVGGLVPATLFNLAVKVAPTLSALPMVIGLQQQWISLGQFLGPLLAAIVVNAYGWGSLWYLTGLWALLGLATSRWLCRQVDPAEG
ncbi:MAG: MFS transporter [Neisseriaceae bacterium]|nr:MFS transporter [Neisseriaceae bacterium]MBP6862952.1 MFS transporter [Neisseriaceae bacterium]